MPKAAPRICTYPGCFRKVSGSSRCNAHRQAQRRQDERQRPSAAKRGYDRRWRKASKQHLSENPLCVDCQRDGAVREATVVDHIVDHQGDPALFWDRANWQSLCKEHHDAKTARDHGFGTRGGSKS